MKPNFTTFSLLVLLGYGASAHRACPADVQARVVDGLGRPLSGVSVEIELTRKKSEGDASRSHRMKLSSDRDGLVKGSYDEKQYSADDASVFVSKEGYEAYSTGLRTDYLLRRKCGPKDVRRTARLAGAAQQAELRELLAGDYEREGRGEDLQELMFLHYRQLRPSLRALVADPKVGKDAAAILAFIAVPDDLRLVIQHAPPAKKELFEDRWAYHVVSGLLEPASEEEWAFLKKCAANEFDDLWVDAGAIESLRLIASSRSLAVLQDVRKQNADREELIARAIQYIESKPPPLSHSNLVEAGKAVAQAIKIGNWEGNKEPRFNDEGDMALIDCEFIAGRDLLIHTATFHQVDGLWKLRGVRETLQGLLADPPKRKAFIGVWHGYSESHLEFARLELRKDGTGLLVISYLPDSPPNVYRVKQWSQQRFKVDITVEPADPEAEPVTLEKISLEIDSLDLELHGKGWERKMTLFNEAEFQRRAGEAKKSLEKKLKSK